MSSVILPALCAVFVWWFSTGLVLYLDRLSARVRMLGLAGLSVLGLAALYGIVAGSAGTSLQDAYLGFLFAIIVWGWHEATFLLGWITGPRRTACPPDITGWARFRMATATIIYHEVALFATLVLIAALTWGGANQVATFTFGILWLARLSTKLNIFLGVSNLTEEFLPTRLDYLKGYFGRRPMNNLFPVSVTIATGIVVVLVVLAFHAQTTAFAMTGYLLLAALAALALIEHWFLVLPLRDAALWRWFTAQTDKTPETSPEPLPVRPQPTTATGPHS